jgi:broad specificity phosphatase PhoE
VRGWEPATVAQERIVGAIEAILSQADDVDVAIIGHGGTGAFSIVISQDDQSIGAMISRQRTAETGSRSTARVGNF